MGGRNIEKELDRSNPSSRGRYWVGSRGRRHDCWGLGILNDYIWEGHLSCLDVIRVRNCWYLLDLIYDGIPCIQCTSTKNIEGYTFLHVVIIFFREEEKQ